MVSVSGLRTPFAATGFPFESNAVKVTDTSVVVGFTTERRVPVSCEEITRGKFSTVCADSASGTSRARASKTPCLRNIAILCGALMAWCGALSPHGGTLACGHTTYKRNLG